MFEDKLDTAFALRACAIINVCRKRNEHGWGYGFKQVCEATPYMSARKGTPVYQQFLERGIKSYDTYRAVVVEQYGEETADRHIEYTTTSLLHQLNLE